MGTPDFQGRHLGDDELFYVKLGAAPVDPLDPSGYTKVGLVTSNPFDINNSTVDAIDKDSARFVSKLVADGSFSVEVETNRKLIPDVGQTILRDASVSGASVYFLISSNVEGQEAVHGAAVVESYSRGSERGAVATNSFSLAGQGAPVFALVPAP